MADALIRYLKEHAEEHPTKPFFGYLAFTVPHFPLQAPSADVEKYRARYVAGWDKLREDRLARQRTLGFPAWGLSSPEPLLRAPSGKPDVEKEIHPGEVAFAVPWPTLSPQQREFQAAKMAVHAAMVDRMDREIGKVLQQLRAMGRLDNTVVLFMSDNGASAEILLRGDGHSSAAPLGSAGTFLCLGPGWSTAANTPFRRHKIWVHEGGVGTPLIVHWPKGIRARGEFRHVPGHVIDLAPTLLELAGGRPRGGAEGPAWPGRSLVPELTNPVRGAAIREREIYFEHQGNRGLRVGDWKIVSSKMEGDAWSLYDLSVDRAESVDLSQEAPGRLAEMANRWQRLHDQFVKDGGR